MRDYRLNYSRPDPTNLVNRNVSRVAAIWIVISFLCLLAPIYGVLVKDSSSIWTGLLIAQFGFFTGGIGLVVGWRCGGWIVAGGVIAVALHLLLVVLAIRFAFSGMRMPLIF